MANNIKTENFITKANISNLSKNSLIVILDDFAGSGGSIRSTIIDISRRYGNINLLSAPLLITKRALNYLNCKSPVFRNSIVFGEVINDLMESNPSKKWTTGYSNNSTCISFFHMTPDNDCREASAIIKKAKITLKSS